MRFEHFQMQVATTTDRNNYYSIVLCDIHYTIDFLSVTQTFVCVTSKI